MNVVDLLYKGLRHLNEEHKEEEEGGQLRGGSAGCVTDNGEIIGSCMRKAHLRYRGVTAPDHPDAKLIMFSGGLGSEEVQVKSLAALGLKVLREEEIPVKWVTKNGVTVTGRPDAVIVDDNNKPIHGIEFKMASTVWTSKRVRFDKQPSMSHLVQTGHYAWQLGIPFTLVYVQYVMFSVPRGAKWVPAKPELDLANLIHWKGNWAQYINPYIYGFEVWFDDYGHLWYKGNNESQGTETNITIKGIEQFYTQASEKAIHPLPKDPYQNKVGLDTFTCNTCPFQKACLASQQRGDNDYMAWYLHAQSLEGVQVKPVKENDSSVVELHKHRKKGGQT